MRWRTVWGGLHLLGLCLTEAAVRGQEPVPPDVTLQSISAEIARQDAALESLLVKYRYTSAASTTEADVRKYLGTEVLCNELHIYAMKGRKRFYSKALSDNPQDTTVDIARLGDHVAPPSLQTAANVCSAFNGDVLRRREPGGTMLALLNVAETLSESGRFNPEYLGLAGRTPPDVFLPADKQPVASLRAVIDAGDGVLRSTMEAVDGVPCVVIDRNSALKNVFWCDPARGFAIVKKDLFHEGGTLLMWRTTLSDFVEILPGQWLPRSANVDRYAKPSAPEELHNVPLLRYHYSVLELTANNVPDSQFELPLQPGMRVIDFNSGKKDPKTNQTRGEMFVVAADGSLEKPKPPVRLPAPEPRKSPILQFAIAWGALLVAVLLVLAWRMRRSLGQ